MPIVGRIAVLADKQAARQALFDERRCDKTLVAHCDLRSGVPRQQATVSGSEQAHDASRRSRKAVDGASRGF
jgi:hypothetical protein